MKTSLPKESQEHQAIITKIIENGKQYQFASDYDILVIAK